jgi:cephalosporin hydroxylase
MTDVFSRPLADTVRDAWAQRNSFDLSSVGYGRIHWDNRTDVMHTPLPYYYFLAGMVRILEARRIVEVGTHHGGSTKALAAGLVSPSESRIVTFDPNPEASRMLLNHPVIRAHPLDANTQEAIDAASEGVDGSCDLVYIDSTHDYQSTLHSWLLYGELFAAPVVILDDITLNDSMRALWSLLQRRYGTDNALDASDIVPEIRPAVGLSRPGFGIVRLRH